MCNTSDINKAWENDTRLIEAIQNNGLVIFAGAGVSKYMGLPDWKELVVEIYKTLRTNYKNDKKLQNIQLDKMSPLEILDGLENYKTDIQGHVSRKFNLPTNRKLDFHQNIIKLTQQIITINYDNGFELAYSQLYNINCPCIAINNWDKYNALNVLRQKEFIFKLHGTASQPESCAIFSSDYNKIYHHKGQSLRILKNLFESRTILFIGTSLNDEVLKNVFNEESDIFGHNSKHFILTSDSTKFENHPYLIPIRVEYTEQIDFLKHYQSFIKSKIIEITDDNMHKYLPLLQRHKLFNNFKKKNIIWILRNTSICKLEEGEVLCRKDEPVKSFWLIISGSIAAYKDGIITTVRQKNSVIGELGLIEERTNRSSDLKAHENGTMVVEIRIDIIQRLFTMEKIALWKNLANILGTKLEKTDLIINKIEDCINSYKNDIDDEKDK